MIAPLPEAVEKALGAYTDAVRECAYIPFTVESLAAREAACLTALRAAIDAAVEAEREACAKGCVRASDECPGTEDEIATWREAAMWCAAAIRARGGAS